MPLVSRRNDHVLLTASKCCCIIRTEKSNRVFIKKNTTVLPNTMYRGELNAIETFMVILINVSRIKEAINPSFSSIFYFRKTILSLSSFVNWQICSHYDPFPLKWTTGTLKIYIVLIIISICLFFRWKLFCIGLFLNDIVSTFI